MINYMKVHNPPFFQLVFFDDEDPSAVEAAFARALSVQREHGGGISVFRAPRTCPLWPGVNVISARG